MNGHIVVSSGNVIEQSFITSIDLGVVDLSELEEEAVRIYLRAMEGETIYLANMSQEIIEELVALDRYLYDAEACGRIKVNCNGVDFQDNGKIMSVLKEGEDVSEILPLLTQLVITDDMLPYLDQMEHDNVTIATTELTPSLRQFLERARPSQIIMLKDYTSITPTSIPTTDQTTKEIGQ